MERGSGRRRSRRRTSCVSCSARHRRHGRVTMKTDELGKRLAALEALVVGVNDALAELRSGRLAHCGSRYSSTARPRTRAGARYVRAERGSAGSDVSTATSSMPHRKIGAIFVEKQLITPGQLALALEEQEKTGRLLGEICVARYGVDRMRLADVLAEQWDGLQNAAETRLRSRPRRRCRVLLDEAHATRAELRLKTGQLNKRLGALENARRRRATRRSRTSPVHPARSPGRCEARCPRKRSATHEPSTKPRCHVTCRRRYAQRRSELPPSPCGLNTSVATDSWPARAALALLASATSADRLRPSGMGGRPSHRPAERHGPGGPGRCFKTCAVV